MVAAVGTYLYFRGYTHCNNIGVVLHNNVVYVIVEMFVCVYTMYYMFTVRIF